MEILLEHDEEEPLKPSIRLRTLAFAATALALAGAAAVSLRKPSQALASRASSVIGLSEDAGCFKKGMFYVGPHKLDGTERTVEKSPQECQERCAAEERCAHFTFWPDGGCLLTGNASYIKAASIEFSNTTVGPKSCKEVATFSVFSPAGTAYCNDEPLYKGASAGKSACELSCDYTAGCNYFSFWSTGGKNWCRLTKTCDSKDEQSDMTITIFKKVETAVVAGPEVNSTVGSNGTTCGAYPACVAAGMEGDCCPNDAKVSLGCCDGFPAPVTVATVEAGAECSAAPACVKLNLTEGGCCPTATGVRLGCCDPL
eukprot:TRINITY_DN6248_c0_g3_i1.p1 TRINITY_DN6248_c0_g3~~TRINITY_DN6248_c0_g3_i1.p1  ORF type:complete len:349 (-),score=77.87 TRINITY_DN6248_c0_g3_i1:122-1063(-)